MDLVVAIRSTVLIADTLDFSDLPSDHIKSEPVSLVCSTEDKYLFAALVGQLSHKMIGTS